MSFSHGRVINKLQWTSCKILKKVQHSVKRKRDLGSDCKYSYLYKKTGTNLFSPSWRGTVRTLLITHENKCSAQHICIASFSSGLILLFLREAHIQVLCLSGGLFHGASNG